MLTLNVIIGPLGAQQPAATHEREVQAYEQGTHTDKRFYSGGNSALRSNNNAVDSLDDWLTFEATAYVALCDTGCTGVTATGIDVRQSIQHNELGIIAVDPAVVPLWSTVELRFADGNTRRAIALDTGGDINGNRIDLLVADEDTAWTFGRQAVELRIIKEAE